MKCCTLPGDGGYKKKGKSMKGKKSKLARASKMCKGKKGTTFKKCLKAKIKKMK